VPTEEALSEMSTSNPPVQYKERLDKPLATSKAGCPGQIAASGRRTLRVCLKPGSRRQSACAAQASAPTYEGETIIVLLFDGVPPCQQSE
jgi:hypothetical protein